MYSRLKSSLSQAKRYFDAEDMVVFLTPPMNNSMINFLQERCDLRIRDNITEPFVPDLSLEKKRCGEKVHIYEIEDKKVIFLDIDVGIVGDLRELFDGTFDVALREETAHRNNIPRNCNDMDAWRNMFETRNKKPVPEPNAAFILFDNGVHKNIAKEWQRHMNEMDFVHPNKNSKIFHKDQYTLALAISGYDIKWLDESIISYSWVDDEGRGEYAVH